MNEVKGSIKFEDIKKGNILWEVIVELNYDGRVQTSPPKKVIPLSDPRFVKWGNVTGYWGFDVRTNYGNIFPACINEYIILTPDGVVSHCDWDTHRRFFKKRKHAMEYALSMREYKMTEYEKKMHLEMALDLGEDIDGNEVPENLYPNNDPDAWHETRNFHQ